MLTVHIGYPKTGTTSIQSFLSTNAEALVRGGHAYPKIGLLRDLSHANLAYELVGDERFDPACGSWADLVEMIRREPGAHYIVSAELLHRVNADKCAALARLLSGVDTRVVVYLRHQAELIQGLYMQAVRARYKAISFDDYFRYQIREEEGRYAYYDCLVRWQEVGALSVRVFEKGALLGDDVVTDFLDAVGVTIDRSALAAEPARKNESKGKKTMAMLHEVQSRLRPRERGPNYAPPVMRALVAACKTQGWNGERCQLLTEEQIDQCETKFRDQNQLVAMRLLQRSDGILFRHRPEPGAPLSDALQGLSREEWLEFTSEFVRHFMHPETDAVRDA